ncbi:hypothetical protein ACP70R_008516 [Stipagrostis hirtigluma subsp. patula]
MDSDVALPVVGGAGDQLSSLGDGVLGHILSFLPAAEAARAAALSRRWRHVFTAVHTVSFEEPGRPVPDDDDDDRGYWSPGYHPRVRRVVVRPSPLVNGVGAALLGRQRGGAAGAAALRALRVVFDEFDAGEYAWAVDGWLSHAVYQAGDELHIDLRLGRQPNCNREYALRSPGDDDLEPDDDSSSPSRSHPEDDEYVVPRTLFSCSVLRTLRLGLCWLDPPAAVALPCLDTLYLTGVTGPRAAVQRLVAGCPRLADLTLEACPKLTALSVPGTRLRRLALRCCHDLATVAADSPELQAFEYRGAVPRTSFLTTPGQCRITSCKLDFCGEEATGSSAMAGLRDLLHNLATATDLHIKSARLGAGVGHDVFSMAPWLPTFSNLRRLDLMGMAPDGDGAVAVVAAMTRILEQTPSLERLSLFFLPDPEPLEEEEEGGIYDLGYIDEEALHAVHKLRYDRYTVLAVPDIEIPCLRERMREINFVHYQGGMAQRTLAKFLLGNAVVVDDVCCVFAHGPLLIQTKLMEEIKGWAMNKSANVKFF